MTDIAWMSLAAMVILVVIGVVTVVLATKRQKGFYLKFPVPFLKETFELSQQDSEGVLREHLRKIDAELFNTFLKITKSGDVIDKEAIDATDRKALDRLVTSNLLHSKDGAPDPKGIELGYLGWQALQNYLTPPGAESKVNPKMDPWKWPQDFDR